VIGRLVVKRRVLHTVRRMRREEAGMKKLAWRFGRFGVYVFLSGLAAKYSPILGPELSASIVGGALAALDKHFGVGRLVSATPTK